MQHIIQKIAQANWQNITESMNQNGYAILPNLLTDKECEHLKADYNNEIAYRKTVVMERHGYGSGEYKYFNYPLPPVIQTIRSHIYTHLSPIANSWFKSLKIDKEFPLEHEALLQQCHEMGQQKATALILKYGNGGFNALHQDIYGEVYFPMQIVLCLSKPDQDFTGGEFILTQQAPRSQSKALVIKPQQGDALVFTTKFKPEKSSKGFRKVNVKHGVSEVTSGERYTLGIIFHDALS
jgi:hypothetical protein